MSFSCRILAAASLALVSSVAQAQNDSTHLSRAWLAPIAVVAAGSMDPEVREWALHQHSRSLDRVARAVNPFGTAHVLVPAMAVTYIGGLVARDARLERLTLVTAAAYVASDLVESALKPMVGRERPHFAGRSAHYHPFTTNGDWHSFPSAHVAHITAIVSALAEQTNSRPVNVIGGGLVSLVAWDRVYEDQHWTSDVVATAMLSSFVSRWTVRWIDYRRGHSP
jgi:membrane-associated phospholipid phosphatase